MTNRRHDHGMRMRRELRWVLWALWVACLVFSVWFIVGMVPFFSGNLPFGGCWMESCASPGR
jgi:hypothetical protein